MDIQIRLAKKEDYESVKKIMLQRVIIQWLEFWKSHIDT